MNRTKTLISLTLALGLALGLLAACGGGSDGPGSGTLNVNIVDAPVDDAQAVVVQFTGVAIKRAGSDEQVVTFATPRTIDLLALQGGLAASLLPNTTVTAGAYEWMRLQVVASGDTDTAGNPVDSYLERTDGTRVPLFVPSGEQSGLKLVSGFSVPAGGTASFTIDFDLRKSVTLPQSAGSPYFLRPALRLVDNALAGGITGSVSSASLGDASCPSTDPALNANVVYVYAGAGVTPDDIGGTGAQPLTTANATNASGTWRYTAAFLAPGSYTVAFSCQAASDDPQANDAPVFLGTQTVTVTAGATATADF